MGVSQELLTSWGIKIGIALAILIIGKFIANIIVAIIKKGMQPGEVEVADSKIVTLAIIGMLKEVSTWYRPDGRLTEEALIERYQTMARQLVGSEVHS